MSKKKKRNKKKSAQSGQAQVSKKKQNRKQQAGKQTAHKKAVKKSSTKQAVIVAPENKPVAKEPETTFSKKLEEVISQTENKKQLFGGKIILLGAPANLIFKRWKSFWSHFRVGLRRFGLILLILVVIAGLLIGLEAFSHNRVFPRVTLAQQNYGYTEIDNARAELSAALDQYEQSSLKFIYQDREVEIPLTELKIELNKDDTIARLPYFQFRQNGAADLLMAAILGVDLKPIFQKDDQQIFNLVENKLDLHKDRAKTASLHLNDQKVVAITPEQEGVIIDQSALQSDLLDRLNSLSTDPVEVQTLREIPEVGQADLEKTMSDLQLKLENNITIKSGEKSWKFRALDHLDLLAFRKQNDQTIVAVPQSLLDNYFQEEVFSQVEKPVSHLKIFYNDQDQIIFEGKALNGEVVNQEKFVNDLEMAINALDPEIELLVEAELATVEVFPRLQELGIKELLGTGHTTFRGSPSNRRHNIAVGMSKFNGLLIKPGETFSFNDNLGEVDGSTGYKLELVIKAEGTVPEYGGGICQVSSTVFKAALFSGLPIVERSPHSYAVSYYAQVDGYGLDSTIYPGVKDLKFTNDTPSSILLQTIVDGDHAYVNVFGTSDGRQVRLENYWRGNYRGAGGTVFVPTSTLPPGAKKQIESAHGGFDASWDRIITKDGQETAENVYSVYRATANRILVGQEPSA